MATTEKPIPFRKEKEIYQTIDVQLKEFNQTFKEQSKCLEDRAATQMAVLEMAHDFLRKWADIELEHSQKMEKLVKSFANKEKSGNNGNISISVCLLGLFSTCGKLGKMYQQLADTITSQVVDRLQVARDESQVVRKQCAPILDQCQDSIRKSCQDLIQTVKPYHTASSVFATADQQFKDAQVEMNKVQIPQSNGSAKSGHSESTSKPQLKKQASVERKVAERHAKRENSLAKVNDERNRHIISISSANASLNCYSTEILPKYIRAMDYCARPAICLTLSSLSKFMAEQAERAVIGVADELKSAVTRCQAENDVALMAHYAPKLFTSCNRTNAAMQFRFQPLRTDEPGELIMPPGIRDNRKLCLTNLNNENAKKLAAIVGDLDRWEQAKWQLHHSHSQQQQSPALMIDSGLGLGPHQPPATIDNYAQTLKQYSEIAEQIAKNDYELSLLTSSVATVTSGYYAPQPNSSFSSPQRGYLYSTASTDSGRPSNDHAISSSSMGSSSSGDNVNQGTGVPPNNTASRTPVFGGSIEDHLNRVGLNDSQNLRSNSATPGSVSVNSVSSINSLSNALGANPPLPQVVVCCVQYLAKYGLRQQGVFRINGSQIEISELKSKFERCENPLQLLDNPSSVNAAASVLKSYFRQLREPLLLPSNSGVTFEQWIATQTSPIGTVEAMKQLITRLPSTIRTVAAFLFVFLNRVSELSSENMMDAYNLAVCFAPCLLPCPNEADQMQHFNALAALIKAMIVNVHLIFTQDDVRLYDEVINNKVNGEKTTTTQEQPVQPQLLRGFRKGSLSTDVQDHDPNSTPAAASLTRQFRTLANIDPVTHSPTSVRSLLTPNTTESLSLLPDDAEAMFNFTARNGHEMSLRRGDRMRIVRKLSEQWWEVMMAGRSGLVPANYLRLLTPAPSPATLNHPHHHPHQTQTAATRTRSVVETTSGNGDTEPAANQHNTLGLSRQSSGSQTGVKTGAERRVFNNETNERADAPTAENGTIGGDVGGTTNQPLWMRRQVSGSDQTAQQQRKSDSVAITSVIDTANSPTNGATPLTAKPASMS